MTYHQDGRKLPKLSIDIEGEPVALLLKARYSIRDEDERRGVRSEASKIFKQLAKSMSENLQIAHRDSHRPRINLGAEAAYLHDYKGLSWRVVSQQACPRKHKHDENCKTNLRKQAEQWYRFQATAMERLAANSVR